MECSVGAGNYASNGVWKGGKIPKYKFMGRVRPLLLDQLGKVYSGIFSDKRPYLRMAVLHRREKYLGISYRDIFREIPDFLLIPFGVQLEIQTLNSPHWICYEGNEVLHYFFLQT